MAQILTLLVLGAVGVSLHGCGGGGEADRTTTTTTTTTSAASGMTWERAREIAEELLSRMSSNDTYRLMQGVGWANLSEPVWGYYIGNVPGFPELGIPSLRMNDAAGGFRTLWKGQIGTVTCWPSQLALAATWSPATVQSFAEALGEEFRDKGANVVLGPSINVHRVAKGGRNYEYLSGEDPYLGSKLTEAYVQGVQSKGVMSVMKHFAFNNQETNRMTASMNVDNRTKWELYYPPFMAAVKAGASAAMCAYNRVDGEYACSSSENLQDLKAEIGFEGFVVSDWNATAGVDVSKGLDMEMPGAPWMDFYSLQNLSKVKAASTHEAAKRIISAMVRLDMINKTDVCTIPNCTEYVFKNVTSDAHKKLALDSAAESVVLLKNQGDALPLKAGTVKTIAIVGSPADAQPYYPWEQTWNWGDYYAGGGSGHVTAPDVVSPLHAITERAKSMGMEVLTSASDDWDQAKSVAAQADVTIVFAATTSGEADDRKNLNLDKNGDGLISAVAQAAKTTVVLLQIPGAVLTGWRDQVDALAVMFLGGQETGSAWAQVVFGDIAPAGRLPLMLPLSEDDTIKPMAMSDDVVVFSEKLNTSYRNPAFKAAYPFGHGLTYTTFGYGQPKQVPCASPCLVDIRVNITNEGSNACKAVPQLYLEFPESAKFPTPILKGFHKTVDIQPKTQVEVSFTLTKDEMKYYDETKHGWIQTETATAHIGESSGDIKQHMHISQTNYLFGHAYAIV